MRTARLACFAVLATGVALFSACGGDDSNGGSSDAGEAGSGDDATTDSGTDAGGNDTGTTDAADASDAPVDSGGKGLDGGACDGGALGITRADPMFAGTSVDTPISITGSGFVLTPTVYLRSGTGALTPLTQVAFVDSTTVNANVPKNTLAVGTYELIVVDPGGCTATLAGFKVTANPAPEILSVSPSQATTQQSSAQVTVVGCHFDGAATLSLVSQAGAVTAESVQSTSCGGDAGGATCSDGSTACVMHGVINASTPGAGGYLVRVTNPDTTYGEYGTFVIVNPDGHLVGNWAASSYHLNTGRRSLGLVAGRVNDANRFLYAVGGEDASGNAQKTVEVAAVGRFGAVGKWAAQRNQLTTARSGLALVQKGQYLYAIGGTSGMNGTHGLTPSGTPLSSVERARILDPAGAPQGVQATASTGGSLAAATYYYRVAAIQGAGATDNPNGETLASDEVVVVVSANGKVSLTWTAVSGATSYVVYRSPTSSSASGSEVLIASGIGTNSYTDDGSAGGDGGDAGVDAGASAQRPLLIGSLGVWTSVAGGLGVAASNTAATVAPDGLGNERVYVVGGWGDCPAEAGSGTARAMDCVQSAIINGAGDTLAAFALDTNKLQQARMRHGLAALTSANGPLDMMTDAGTDGGPNNTAFLVVSGGGPGISQSSPPTMEYESVGGAVHGAWLAPSAAITLARDGSQLQIANDFAYVFFGGTVNSGGASYRNTSDISTSIQVSSSTLTFGSWQNANGGNGPTVGRNGLTLESAYFFVVGGTSNDTDALDTVYSILY